MDESKLILIILKRKYNSVSNLSRSLFVGDLQICTAILPILLSTCTPLFLVCLVVHMFQHRFIYNMYQHYYQQYEDVYYNIANTTQYLHSFISCMFGCSYVLAKICIIYCILLFVCCSYKFAIIMLNNLDIISRWYKY